MSDDIYYEVELNEDEFAHLIQCQDLVNISSEVDSERVFWNGKATKLLVSLYKQQEPLLGSNKFKNKKTMWENISKKMKEAGYAFSALQVENRFKTLLRAYKKVHPAKNLSVKSRKNCMYQEEIDTIFLKDVAKLGNVEIQFEQDESNESFELEDVKQNKSFLNINSDVEQAIKKVDWDEQATNLLLTLYKEKKPLVETKHFKSKKEMWENIAEEINSRSYMFSRIQVENRFKTLLRSYKKVLMSGTRSKTCAYQEELDALFLEDDDVFPEVIAGAERLCLKKEVSERLGVSVSDIEISDKLEKEDDTHLSEEKKVSGIVGSEAALYRIRNILAQSEKKAAQRHSEVMKALKEMNEIQRKRNELFERLIEVQMNK